jgi:Erv1 / Alr family
MKKTKLISNPAIIGSGAWYIITLKAKHAITDEAKNEFIDFMYMLSVEFICGNCRNHIQAYLRDHPFEPYMNLKNDKGEDVGMFKWVWTFHNAVNIRLAKPYVDWETAWGMYDTGAEVCTNCTGSNSNSQRNSFDDSFEKDKIKEVKKPIMMDKKAIIQGYFKKNK